MIRAALILLLLLPAVARAASVQFTTPSQDVLGGPAGVRRINVWFINCEPAHPRYNAWKHTWGAACQTVCDGQPKQYRVTPYVCAPGDSCGARVSCADASGNWARDTTIYFRIPRP